MEIVYILFGLIVLAQCYAVFMWAVEYWLYKKDAMYRVKFGKPSIWLWNQLRRP